MGQDIHVGATLDVHQKVAGEPASPDMVVAMAIVAKSSKRWSHHHQCGRTVTGSFCESVHVKEII